MAYYFSIRFAEIMSIHQGSSPSNKLVSQFIVKIFSQATSEAKNEKNALRGAQVPHTINTWNYKRASHWTTPPSFPSTWDYPSPHPLNSRNEFTAKTGQLTLASTHENDLTSKGSTNPEPPQLHRNLPVCIWQ